VLDAAAAAPQTAAGERAVYAAVSKGSAEISEILRRSNGDINSIAGRLGDIDVGYRAVGSDLRLGTGDQSPA
jgi:hypothetical protein